MIIFLENKIFKVTCYNTGFFSSSGCAAMMFPIIEQVIKNTNMMFISFSVMHSVIHFMNAEKVRWMIRKAIYNVYICLNHS